MRSLRQAGRFDRGRLWRRDRLAASRLSEHVVGGSGQFMSATPAQPTGENLLERGRCLFGSGEAQAVCGAAYEVFRRDAAAGQMPSPGTVDADVIDELLDHIL